VVSGFFSTPAVREAEIRDHHRALDPTLPTLVAGDFNESGGGRALKYLGERGFHNVLPAERGSTPTWRWQTSVGTLRLQLDHLVVDQGLQVLDVEVLEAGRSDHLPVVGEFRRRPPNGKAHKSVTESKKVTD
jgi:endonuclease/exonuclease/phosphatase (EEP) superfamily protein YafD